MSEQTTDKTEATATPKRQKAKRYVPVPLHKDALRACILADSGDYPAHAVANIQTLQRERIIWNVPEFKTIWQFIDAYYDEHKDAPGIRALREHFRADDVILNELQHIEGMKTLRHGELSVCIESWYEDALKSAHTQVLKTSAAINAGTRYSVILLPNGNTYEGPIGAAAAIAYETHALASLGQGEALPAEDRNNAEKLNETLAYIEAWDKVWDCNDKMEYTRKAIELRGGAYKVWISKKFDGKRRAYSRTAFDPRPEPRVTERELNLYDPTRIVRPSGNPVIFGGHPDLDLFSRLVKNLSGGRSENSWYIVQWLAHKVQHPEYNKQCALVLRGEKGSGKGLFGDICRAIFGPYCNTVDQKRLEDKWNTYLYRKLLIVANEITAEFFRDKRGQMGTLKGLVIGDPIQVEPKGKDTVERENFTTWLICSNSAVPILLEVGDRRYSVVTSYKSLQESDPELIPLLVQAIADPEWIQRLVDWLGQLNLHGFVPNVPLDNPDRAEMTTASLSSTELWWRDCLPPAGTYPIDVLYRHYVRGMDGTGEPPVSLVVFSRSAPMGWPRSQRRKEQFRLAPYANSLKSEQFKCIAVPDKGQCSEYAIWRGLADDDDQVRKLANVIPIV